MERGIGSLDERAGAAGASNRASGAKDAVYVSTVDGRRVVSAGARTSIAVVRTSSHARRAVLTLVLLERQRLPRHPTTPANSAPNAENAAVDSHPILTSFGHEYLRDGPGEAHVPVAVRRDRRQYDVASHPGGFDWPARIGDSGTCLSSVDDRGRLRRAVGRAR